MLEVIGLVLWHEALVAGMVFLITGTGLLAFPYQDHEIGEHPADALIAILIRSSIGMALFSVLIAAAGLLHILNGAILWVPMLLAGAVGWLWQGRAVLGSLQKLITAFSEEVRSLSPAERLAGGVNALAILIPALVILSGGLVPDVGQDSLWYHLTVPGQWVIRGDVAMFPLVMPSSYPLAAEALIAGILTVGDHITVTAAYSWVLLAGLLSFPLFTWRIAGIRIAALTAGIGGMLFAARSAIAPLPAGNDVYASLTLLLAVWIIARRIIVNEPASIRDWLMAGLIAGFSVGAKIIAVGYLVPTMAILTVLHGMAGRWKPSVFLGPFVFSAAWLAVMGPWLIRGFVYCGNPLLPVSQSLFPVNDEFRFILDGYENEPRRMFPFTVEGIVRAITIGIPRKHFFAMSQNDGFFLLILVMAIVGAASRRRIGMVLGALSLSCYAAFVMIDGSLEIIRYFSLSYLIAAPLLGFAFLVLSEKLAPKLFVALTLLLLAASTNSWIVRQGKWAGFHTIQWDFLPKVTADQQLEFSINGEFGGTLPVMRALEPHIPADAHVLFAENPGPYYLHRRATWSSFACPPVLSSLFDPDDPKAAMTELKEREIDYLFSEEPHLMPPAFQLLREDNSLQEIPADLPLGMLFRVNTR